MAILQIYVQCWDRSFEVLSDEVESAELRVESEDYIQLVRRAKQGDMLAYNTLCQEHGSSLCMFLTHRVGNEEDACEIAQEALLKAWEDLPNLREERYFKTWLYRIAINKTKNFLRRARYRHWLPWEKYELLAVTQESGVEFEVQVAEKDLVHRAMERVSPKYRYCLLLQIVGEFRQSEIAELLDIPVKYVSTYVKRGLVQLTKAYYSLEHELDTPEA